MGKKSRKRQRTENDGLAPMGTRVDHANQADKDDEERRLESLLFGVPFIPLENDKESVIDAVDDEDIEGIDEAGAELEAMLDADLFFVDEGLSAPHLPAYQSLDNDQNADAGSSRANSPGDDVASDPENALPTPAPSETAHVPTLPKPRAGKAPAWTDPDDATLTVDVTSARRLRKLRDAPDEDRLGGREYERRLRRQFEKVNPTPEWAAKARKRRRRSSIESRGDEGGIEDLLKESSGIISGARRRTIQQGTLSIERLRDANQAAPAEGEIKAIQFHPSPQVPLLLSGSADRRLRLYNVDGHTNPHLQTVHIPELPVTAAQFNPAGTSILLTGKRPYYYTYDLETGTTTRSPRGLWGTTFEHVRQGGDDLSMELAAFDPTGNILAVGGRRGYTHLVDWRAGGGQIIGSVKGNATVSSIWWSGGQLMTLGEDAEVYVWDVGERRCLRRWKDDGGFGSRVLTGDRAGNYGAVGSKSGIVNVYGSDIFSQGSSTRPKPLRALGNLTTTITAAKFSHDSQLLAIASSVKKDQLRMIHLPSLTAFSNWPTSSTPLGHVTAIDFSATNEYIAMGNNRGRVLLYHLRDFAPL